MKKPKIVILCLLVIISLNLFNFQQFDYTRVSQKDKSPKMSIQDITITSPENKSYLEPMSGYYPATYGFENETSGTKPQGWITTGNAGDPTVIDSLGTHNKVVELADLVAIQERGMYQDFNPQSSGTVEWWWRSSDSNDNTNFNLYNSGTQAIYTKIGGGYFAHFTSTWTNIIPCSSNTWYHLRVDFDSNTGINGQYNLTINEVRVITNQEFINSVSTINRVSSATSTLDVGYISYLDAIGYSWDPNYNIGDNLQEGLLLSFSVGASLVWKGYSLDGQTNKSIMGNIAFPIPIEGLHTIQVFGNDSGGGIHESELRYFSVNDIIVNSPENKTYTELMSGYYPATIGFENETSGIKPQGWIITGNGGDPTVIDSLGTHNKVVRLVDVSGAQEMGMYQDFIPQSSGTIEWWWRSSDSTPNVNFNFYNSGTQAIYTAIGGGYFRHFTSGWTSIIPCSSNTWYHLRVDFDSNAGINGQYNLTINGVQEISNQEFINNVASINRVSTATSTLESNYNAYIDAIGYSWDPNYIIGDNYNEGMLLSFEIYTSLVWMGYSFDGQANRTITGNTTFSIPDDGLHEIQVFGKNAIGTIFESKITNFEVDLKSPVISINSPSTNQFFGENSPTFDISITELNLNYTWYTIDNGVTNTTFTGLTGTINQTEWDKLSTGPAMIRFYANDTYGREDYVEVEINKDLSAPIIMINSPTVSQFFGSSSPSFDLSITESNLNTSWYTLDSGATNNTFTGLAGTISQTEWDKYSDGPINIIFYANDTFGKENYAQIAVNKDITDPILIINAPSVGEIFTELPPSYNISVTEDNLDSMWYTIDEGTTDIPFTSSNGFISSTAWNNAAFGAITIRFYAKDLAGNEVYQEVVIIKQSPSVPPSILGYDMVILVSVISVVSMLIIRKRRNK